MSATNIATYDKRQIDMYVFTKVARIFSTCTQGRKHQDLLSLFFVFFGSARFFFFAATKHYILNEKDIRIV